MTYLRVKGESKIQKIFATKKELSISCQLLGLQFSAVFLKQTHKVRQRCTVLLLQKQSKLANKGCYSGIESCEWKS